ncbi:hypothetical protein [Qipengyuania atrilutea]|uniref:Phage ABA sandwich domain-containing protein n=1 Tax=Qipengyuania atrilutea TaxID=2744473 RepID=A0A850H502_9SPHN|nr:hypothetical protein [Actirhodobacter atriluteus]NVD45720.1 hypothetical protein [Actirhodobacter atriluteus]
MSAGLTNKLEQATEGSRELDAEIWLALVADEKALKAYHEGAKISAKEAAFRADYMMDGMRYSSSLDAAMSLVPEGYHVELERWADNRGRCEINWPSNTVNAWGSTLPLALCIAAIRSRRGE